MGKKQEPYSSKTTARTGSTRGILALLYVGSKVVFWWKGIKVKLKNNVGKPQTPCIVLCNHGAFGDFAYAGTILRKWSPSFIVARLYFCHKWLGKLCRRLNCFPKSMFAIDLERAKNCMRVLKHGGVLAMMPEARLSTVGKFEDIQEGTFSFLQKAGVPIYTIKIGGDYFSQPKWGDGMRRGSLIEAEMNLLFTAEEAKALPLEELKRRTEDALRYDEWQWLEEHPKVTYRRRSLAEGLENILTRCPKCGKKYTIVTKGHDVLCEACGLRATLDRRYGFVGATPFANFAQWYEWQMEEYRKEIEGDPNFALTAEVKLRHASKDGKKMLRLAGNGTCTLDRTGLTYRGTRDGETIEKHFSQKEIYRLLFGPGEDFEIYEGKEIWYFTPGERRSCIDWYMVSILLKDMYERQEV